MKRQQTRRRSSMVLLILGMVFLMIGLATNQTTFTWISIALVLISLVIGGKWVRRK